MTKRYSETIHRGIFGKEMKITLWWIGVFLMYFTGIAAPAGDTSIKLFRGEGWYGGAVGSGMHMPFGDRHFSFRLRGDASGNQSNPVLISTKGRWIWSEHPFTYIFRNDSLIVSETEGPLLAGKSGISLRDAYRYASRQFFPPSGKWPDSLLVTAPQYNLWIELLYNPNQGDVLRYAYNVLANGFPAGVLMVDDNWSTDYGVFDFNPQKFPQPKQMIDSLHRLGFKVMLWICPFISPDSEAFRELSAKRLLLIDNLGNLNLPWREAKEPLLIRWWNGYSACLDLSNPAAVAWLQEKLTFLQKTYGVDGFKFDAGDAYFYDNTRLVSYKPISPNEHSRLWSEVGLNYPLNEYRATWKMAGQPLVQRLSDKDHSWEALQQLIPNTIAQQLNGYTFTCPDMIGGGQYTSFTNGARIDPLLIVRSAQCHTLMPMMQFSVAPWRILDSTHLAAVKEAVATRQTYLPLLMEIIRFCTQSGEPVLRPMEYNYPGRGYATVRDQFMIGEQLLVAPMVTKENEREVVLPPGVWTYKGKNYQGGRKRTFPVALNELLIFKRKGQSN